MLENKQWGEFFPTNISPYAYNESLANIYFPLSKEEVLSKGWQWKNIEEKISKESPLEEVLNCSACGKNYKIIKQEQDFYKKYSLCPPSKCPNCRYKQRIDSMNPMEMWERQCMRSGCHTTFKTTYASNRPEIIYCEKCYLDFSY